MGCTILYAVIAAKAVTSTKSAVSQMRMLRRGLNSPPVFDANRFLALRQRSRSRPFPADRSLAENISDTPRGVDEFGVPGVALYLLAEVADVDVHRAFVAELVAPYPAQQRAAREHPAGTGGQSHQQLELGVGEVDLFTIGRHPAAGKVDPEPVVGQLVGALASRYRRPTHDRPDARHQLPDGERLGHVIVRPELEPDDSVYLVVAGGEHDDGHVALGADPSYYLRAVELGEHDVEHDQVRLVALERFQGGLAVTRDLDLEPLALEGMREHLLERRLVVDQKYLARHTL